MNQQQLFKYIQQNNKLPKERVDYPLKQLKQKLLIEKIGYGVWKTIKPFYTREKGKKLIRGHGFSFTFQIPNIYKWNKREVYLIKKKIPYEELNQYIIRIKINNKKIWLCKKSIVIYFEKEESYIETKAKYSKEDAISEALKIIKKLETLFKVSFKINKEYIFKISKQHQAIMKSKFAENFNKRRKYLKVRNENGLWLITDYSFKIDETEGVHKDTADKDIDKVINPFLNDLKDYNEKTGETIKITDIIKITASNTANIKEYAENIKLHLKVLQDLGKAVDELRKEVKK